MNVCTEKTEIYRDNERYVGIHIVRIYTNTRSLHVCHDVHNVHITYIYILYIIIIIIVTIKHLYNIYTTDIQQTV